MSADYLRRNLIYPDEFIQDEHRTVIMTARDGRTWLGSIVAESDRQVLFCPVEPPEMVLRRAEVQSKVAPDASLMLEGLVESRSARVVLDLFVFLRRTEASAP